MRHPLQEGHLRADQVRLLQGNPRQSPALLVGHLKELGPHHRRHSRGSHQVELQRRQLLQGSNENLLPQDRHLRRPGIHRLQDPALRQKVRAQPSHQEDSEGELSALRRVQRRILAAALVTCQNRPGRGHRARRRPAQVLATRAVDEKEGKVPILNLEDRQEEKRLLEPSGALGSRSAGRKKARKKRRLLDRNNYCQLS